MTESGKCGSGTDQIVVSLCDHTGNMVRPWAAAGYECYCVDLKNDDTTEHVGDGVIHYVNADVREWTAPDQPVRIGFAFPPCTDLAVSGARWFKDKGLSALAKAIELVAASKDTLTGLDCPWMLENPKSTLSTHWRQPDYRFHPYEFDAYTGQNERYTKDTWLWTGGGFRMPRTDGVREDQADDRIHKMPPSDDRSEKRAETPTGFARAVMLAHEFPDEYARADTGTEQQTLVTDGGTDTGDTDRRPVDELLAVDYVTVDELRRLRPRPRDLPPEHELDDAECHNCGEPWNDGEGWDERHLAGGPSLGEDWKYSCPNCGFETFEVGT